jgi:GST-like protein
MVTPSPRLVRDHAHLLMQSRSNRMIDLYYWGTPNGLKLKLFMEESGLPHRIILVDIGKGAQFEPDFLKVSPNNKIPALVDLDPADGGAPISLFESGAMLLYLAEKTGRFIPADVRGRAEVLQWLFWQVGGLGPMAGQNGHFIVYAPEKVPYAIERYMKETNRLYGVLDKRLADRGHGVLSVDRSARDAWPEPRRLPQPEALVRNDQGASGHDPRLRRRSAALCGAQQHLG